MEWLDRHGLRVTIKHLHLHQGDTNIYGDHNVVDSPKSQSASQGGIAAGGSVSGSTTAGGADARHGSTAATAGSMAAQHGSGAGTSGATTTVGFVEKAKGSTHAKVWGLIAWAIIAATTVLLLTNAFSLAWGGYIIGAIAAAIGIVPILGGG